MIISADSHICEPPNLWTSRLNGIWKDRAPRIVRNLNDKPGDFFVCEDVMPRSVYAAFAAGAPSSQYPERSAAGFDLAPASVWDPKARLREQDLDGVSAEILYPTMADIIFGANDADFRRTCFSAYNDFIAEYCENSANRLFGIGIIDLEDLALAISEVKRCGELNLCGILIRADPLPGTDYADPRFDAFWEAVIGGGFAVTIHRGAVRRDITQDLTGSLTEYVMIPQQIQRLLISLIFGGVWERFPQLKVVCSEFDIAWLPHFLHRFDHAFDKFGKTFGMKLSRRPSEQIRQSVFFTFIDEVSDVLKISDCLSEENLLWSSDYPHADSTFPQSQQIVGQIRQLTSSDKADLMLFGNSLKVYGLENRLTA